MSDNHQPNQEDDHAFLSIGEALSQKDLNNNSIYSLLERISVPMSLYNISTEKFEWVNTAFMELSHMTKEDLYNSPTPRLGDWIERSDMGLMKSRINDLLDFAINKHIHYDTDRVSFKVNLRHSKKINKKIWRYMLVQSNVITMTRSLKPELIFDIYTDINDRKFSNKVVLTVKKFNRHATEWEIVEQNEITRDPEILGKREIEVMKLILNDHTCSQVAEELNVSFYTIRAHCRNILRKANCHSTSELKSLAMERGWV